MFTRLNPPLMTYLDLMFGAGTSFCCLPLCWTLLFSWKRTHMHTISFHYQLIDTFKTNSYITGSKCHIKPGLSNYNPHPDGTAWQSWERGIMYVCLIKLIIGSDEGWSPCMRFLLCFRNMHFPPLSLRVRISLWDQAATITTRMPVRPPTEDGPEAYVAM